MKIVLAQINPVFGDFHDAFENIVHGIRIATRQHADLVVFPAATITGTGDSGVINESDFVMETIGMLSAVAQQTPIPVLVPVLMSTKEEIIPLGEQMEYFLCFKGAVSPVPTIEWALDVKTGRFTESRIFVVNDVRIGLFMDNLDDIVEQCPIDLAIWLPLEGYDWSSPDSLMAGSLALNELDIVAKSSGKWFAGLQPAGALDDVIYAGSSYIMAPWGEAIAAVPFETEYLVATIDINSEGPLDDPRKPVGMEPLQALWRGLTMSIRDYFAKNSQDRAVVGLSGGIDSSVVASLAVDALGKENVLGILMPGPYSSESSVTDALELAKNLGIETMVMPIMPMFDAFVADFERVLGAPFEGVARENLQARIRGDILMSISNARGGLVLNTGNKSEAAMGYSTLYGDTVGAFAPLADVLKTFVFDLADYRRKQGPSIPENVLIKPPSAELSEGQTDEGNLGVSYEQIDAVLIGNIDRGLSAAELINDGLDEKTVRKVLKRLNSMEFKRRQEPFGPRVSTKSLSDRNWPITSAWEDKSEVITSPSNN